MTQTDRQITATRSVFTLTGGGITLTVTFLSPVDPDDTRRQSAPFGYVTVEAATADGASHAVEVYLDTSGSGCTATRPHPSPGSGGAPAR
ncbi:DUF5127 domain-containing protein [Streptomyces sp. M19]